MRFEHGRYHFIILFFFFILFLSLTETDAFEVCRTGNGSVIKWSTPSTTYHVNPLGSLQGSLSAILSGMDTWTNVSNSNFVFSFGGEISSCNPGVNDETNIVCFGSMGTSGILGRNTYWFYSDGEMIDSDIEINTDVTWSISGSPGTFDLQSVATHEFGHSLCLSHSNLVAAIMYYSIGMGQLKRSLHQDDIDGIISIYPGADAGPPVGSVVINGGAAYTPSASVTLSLSASDPSGVSQMCVSHTMSCAVWEGYASSKVWTLTSGDGNKVVYVWFKDGLGNVNSSPYSDSIVLDTVAPTDGTLSAGAGEGQVSLSWQGFSDGLSGMGGYRLVYSTAGFPGSCSDGTLIYNGSGTSYHHTGLVNGVMHYYRLCGTDNAENVSSGVTASAMPQSSDTDPPVGSVVINGGAAYTHSASVTLSLSASDPGGVSQMCVSHTMSCAAWEGYVSSKTWTLTSGDGNKVVYVWFKDGMGNGNTTPYSDSIILDATSPLPNPMVWATLPYATGVGSISMVSATASDSSGPVNYYVDFVDSPTGGAGGTDSGWQSGTSYTDSGLEANHRYGYRVKARDGANNETGYSSTQYAYTGIEVPAGVSFGAVSASDIQVRSANTPSGLDRASSGLLIENSSRGTSSGWKQSNGFWTSDSLSPNTNYSFRIKARNGEGLETGYSPVGSKYTLASPPGVLSFSNITQTCIRANWTANGNPAGTQFYCENQTLGTHSGWITTISWESCGLICDTSYRFRVKAKNEEGVETGWILLGSQSTVVCDTTAPDPPQGLVSIPTVWTNTNCFNTNWTNPNDPSGIAAVWYKIGNPPISSTDGTRIPENNIQFLSGLMVPGEGENPLFLWLEDGAGNKDHQNRSQTVLRYDRTPPLNPRAGFLDEFSESPSHPWEIIHEDVATYSLNEAPDHLRIYTTPSDIWGGTNNLINLFFIPTESLDSFRVTAPFSFPIPPQYHPQQAGMILFADLEGSPDMDNYIGTTYGYIDGDRRLQRIHERNGHPEEGVLLGPILEIGTQPIWIRLIKGGDEYQSYYSLDGENFILFDSIRSSLEVAYVGLGAFHRESHLPSIPVDFESFEILSSSSSPESHGVISEVWQNGVNDPAFMWSGASDSGSGIAGYFVYWGSDPNGTSADFMTTPGYNPPPVTDGVYYLRVKTKDQAGNEAPWTTLFTFKYDGTASSNPTHFISNPSKEIWSTDPTIDISWTGADDLSGVFGYSYIWDHSSNTLPDKMEETLGNGATTPTLTDGQDWYFHIRTMDYAGNWTAEGVHYGPFYIDTTPPTNPTLCVEHHGTLDHVWQNGVSAASFTWSGALDSGSGVKGYYWYFGTDPAGDPTLWTTDAGCDPLTVSSGIYYLRVKTEDHTGNQSFPITLFTFQYDGTPPNNPTTVGSTKHSLGSWSNQRSIEMNWAGTSDAHSGVYGYSYEFSQSLSTIPDDVVDTQGTMAMSSSLSDGNNWYFHIRTRDEAGNWSNAVHRGPYSIDGSPPTHPTHCIESHGVGNHTWQSGVKDPAFTWSGAFDSGSGIAGYFVYWGADPQGTSTQFVTTSSDDPPAIMDGVYYLRMKTQDGVGNESPWETLFTFKYDSTVPPNPTACAETHGVAHNTWQNTVKDPVFVWSRASDNGSGIKGYYWYFGMDPSGDPMNWTTTAGCDPSELSSGTYYLRVKTEDEAGNRSSPVTLFTFKYDGSPPTAGFLSINNGAPTTLSLTANLTRLGATDMNGLFQMRFSNNPNGPWTSPEPYASTKTDWDLSSFGGHSTPGNKTVLVKFQDNVGNWSDPFSSQIYYQPLQTFPFKDDFSIEKGWFGYAEGKWERGAAGSGGDENGTPGLKIDGSISEDNYRLGFAIRGDDPENLTEESSVISPPIRCTGQDRVFLKFRRFLNIGGNAFDHARISVNVDGLEWVQVWENSVIDITDDQWVPVVLDITSVAANQETVYIKFTMGPTNSPQHFSHWNIDDLEVTSEAIYPSEGTYGTELAISGYGFGSNQDQVILNRVSLKLQKTVEGSVRWKVAKVLTPGVYDVTIQSGESKDAHSVMVNAGFVVRAAEIHSIEQGEGSAYDEVKIKGKFFGTKKGKVYLEVEEEGRRVRKSCKVMRWWMDPVTNESEIFFIVPKMLPEVCDVVVDPYGAIPGDEEEDSFTVKAPQIESVHPSSGSVGSRITISGNYFGPNKSKVYLGYLSKGKPTKKSCSILNWSDEEIVFVVPNLPAGEYDVIVTNRVDSDRWLNGLTILNK